MPVNNKYIRKVFLLTDGGCSSLDEMVKVVSEGSKNAQLFTFGVGSGVDVHLVKTLAKAGLGHAEIISDTSAPSIKAAAVRQLSYALQEFYSNITINYNTYNSDKLVQSPTIVPILFPYSRFILYARNILLDDNNNDNYIEISYIVNKKDKTNEWVKNKIPINVSNTIKGNTIHKLAAKANIKEYEFKLSQLNGYYQDKATEIKKVILDEALNNRLVSSQTSFIALIKDSIVTNDKPKNPTIPKQFQSQLDILAAPSKYTSPPQDATQVNPSFGFAISPQTQASVGRSNHGTINTQVSPGSIAIGTFDPTAVNQYVNQYIPPQNTIWGNGNVNYFKAPTQQQQESLFTDIFKNPLFNTFNSGFNNNYLIQGVLVDFFDTQNNITAKSLIIELINNKTDILLAKGTAIPCTIYYTVNITEIPLTINGLSLLPIYMETNATKIAQIQIPRLAIYLSIQISIEIPNAIPGNSVVTVTAKPILNTASNVGNVAAGSIAFNIATDSSNSPTTNTMP